MSRRRKDKRKRRAIKEDKQAYSEPRAAAESEVEKRPSAEEPVGTEIEQLTGDPAPVEIQGDREPVRKPDTESQAPGITWLSRNRENLLLGVLALYVLLLGLGTTGELFEIEWILNLPIFR
ncbi:MAG: hypothetical protein ACC669_11160 [bacterium]